jgi:uncharacterized protein (TIGR02996 family)
MAPTDPTELRLLRAVCADPFDDAPREAFADWCRGVGRVARADYIQAALAGDGVRAGTIRTNWGDGWDWPVSAFDHDGGRYRGEVHSEWERGFVVAVRLPPPPYHDFAQRIFSCLPVLAVALNGIEFFQCTPPAQGVYWQTWRHDSSAPPYYAVDHNQVGSILFDRLGPDGEAGFIRTGATTNAPARVYPTYLSALADVSRAAVSWGRERAGLPAVDITRTVGANWYHPLLSRLVNTQGPAGRRH